MNANNGATVAAMRDLVYISYCPRDKKFHKELREIFDRDVRVRDIVWDDTKIRKGANVGEEIAEHVARAKIMVMLVSPNYLAPDCSAWDGEIKPAMQAREQGELIVLWIPVGAVRASETPFPDIHPAGDVSLAFSKSRASFCRSTSARGLIRARCAAAAEVVLCRRCGPTSICSGSLPRPRYAVDNPQRSATDVAADDVVMNQPRTAGPVPPDTSGWRSVP